MGLRLLIRGVFWGHTNLAWAKQKRRLGVAHVLRRPPVLF